jgi:hypothetical protein
LARRQLATILAPNILLGASWPLFADTEEITLGPIVLGSVLRRATNSVHLMVASSETTLGVGWFALVAVADQRRKEPEKMKQFWSTLSQGAKIGFIIGTVASAPFAVYIGVVSGTLGGGWGWNLAGKIGAMIGVVIAIILVAGIILLTGASVGGLIGSRIGRLFKGTRQTQ